MVCHSCFLELHVHSTVSLLLIPSSPLKGSVLGAQVWPREYLTFLCPQIDVKHQIILMTENNILVFWIEIDD